MQEKNSLAESPQRRGWKLIPARTALRNIVRQPSAHVMDLKIRKSTYRRITQRGGDIGWLGGADRRGVASRTADRLEQCKAIRDRLRATGRGQRLHGRGKQAHELREQ